MTKRKHKQTLYRDELGRFVSASVKIQEAMAAMRGQPVTVQRLFTMGMDGKVQVIEYPPTESLFPMPDPPMQVYCDAIYRPERKSWLERFRNWLMAPEKGAL